MAKDNLDSIRKAVIDRRHILIFGRWGSGRTTLLEMLSDIVEQHALITSVEVWSGIYFRLGRNLTSISTSLSNPEQRPAGWPCNLDSDGSFLLVDDLHDEEAKLSANALRAARGAKGSIMTMTHYSESLVGSAEGVVQRLKEWSAGDPAITNMILHLDHGRDRPWIDGCWNLSSDWHLDRVW
jgi:type IV secretory pathway ATPase VirB11/archaellum biosynthesis ATPase